MIKYPKVRKFSAALLTIVISFLQETLLYFNGANYVFHCHTMEIKFWFLYIAGLSVKSNISSCEHIRIFKTIILCIELYYVEF